MSHASDPPEESPQRTAAKVAATFSSVTDERSRVQAIRRWLLTVPCVIGLLPTLFAFESYWFFGTFEVGELGWGITVFFVVYCLLWALGLYFLPKSGYHTTVGLRRNWLDRLGAFWPVACAIGPFFGWLATTGTVPLTIHSWRWLYLLRLFLAAGLPVLTALPLLRYVRGKASLIQLPLLLVVTTLPILSAMNVSRDLLQGPAESPGSTPRAPILTLPHTGRPLQLSRLFPSEIGRRIGERVKFA